MSDNASIQREHFQVCEDFLPGTMYLHIHIFFQLSVTTKRYILNFQKYSMMAVILLDFYRPPTKLRKGNVLHLFVIHSVHSRGVSASGSREYLLPDAGDFCFCVKGVSASGSRGHPSGHTHTHKALDTQTPKHTHPDTHIPLGTPTPSDGQQAGLTHPAGMHSCVK